MHAVHTSQKGCQSPQHGHEPTEEYDLPAMSHEEVLAELDLALSDPSSRSITKQNTVAELLADPIADVVPKDSPRYGRHDHEPDAHTVGGSGIDARDDQGRLARKRDPHALQHYDAGDGEIAIGGNEISKLTRDVHLYQF